MKTNRTHACNVTGFVEAHAAACESVAKQMSCMILFREPGVMARPPRPPNAPLLSRFMLWRVVLVSSIFASVTLGLLLPLRRVGQTTYIGERSLTPARS